MYWFLDGKAELILMQFDLGVYLENVHQNVWCIFKVSLIIEMQIAMSYVSQ